MANDNCSNDLHNGLGSCICGLLDSDFLKDGSRRQSLFSQWTPLCLSQRRLKKLGCSTSFTKTAQKSGLFCVFHRLKKIDDRVLQRSTTKTMSRLARRDLDQHDAPRQSTSTTTASNRSSALVGNNNIHLSLLRCCFSSFTFTTTVGLLPFHNSSRGISFFSITTMVLQPYSTTFNWLQYHLLV